jgi:hypothetical protein
MEASAFDTSKYANRLVEACYRRKTQTFKPKL